MKSKTQTLFLAIFASASAMLSAGMVWEKGAWGIDEPVVKCLLVDPRDKNTLVVGSEKAIYQSGLGHKESRRIFSVPAGSGTLNALTADSEGLIYAATDWGLFVSDAPRAKWQKVFSLNAGETDKCLWVTVAGGTVYLGTTKGLYLKKQGSANWQRKNGELQSSPVYFIGTDNAYTYFATDSEIFREGKGPQDIQKVFSLTSHEINGAAEDLPLEENGLFVNKSQIKFFYADAAQTPFLYIVTVKGIFTSADHGKSWQRLDSDGLPLKDATSLLPLGNSKILLGSTKGVFLYDGQKWGQVYKGLETDEINFLASDGEGNIYAASNRGVFLLAKERDVAVFGSSPEILSGSFLSREPSIRDVQEMAIDYAEVHPGKIESWRYAAKHRAWLPTVSVGLDRNATDIRHWDTGPNPDVLQKGKEIFEWDIGLSWDLGDLVWNSDQTSIDSRSKLMVELREDVLDQVTRLYFERRRLQMELAMNATLLPQEKIDKELRVEELTALMDGFTGGKFSRKIQTAEK